MTTRAHRLERMDDMTSLDDAAREFLAAALAVLRGEHVVPTPVFNPFLRVGRDYIGDSVTGLREFAAFEGAIADRHPRFKDDASHQDRDFADGYVFSFLEAVIAETALNREACSADAPSVDACLSSLTSEIEADSWEVACCREVSNLTTASGESLELSAVTVIPVNAPRGGHDRETAGIIAQVIPHSQSCYERTSLGEWDHPHSIVVAHDDCPQHFDLAPVLSGRIDEFMLAARLLHAGSCESLSEVQGETSLVRRSAPRLVRFRGAPSPFSLTSVLRRTTCLEPQDTSRFAGLAEAVTAAQGDPEGMYVTSIGMAKHKFAMSYHAHSWDEQLVDLATALEAALSGTATTDVVLRLKTRASALLATENDPAGAIFKDIGTLYDLRSRLIHGSALPIRRLVKSVKSITTVPESLPNIAVAHAVDRFRDLVRRALLARICLAACEPPLWALGNDENVDVHLADASTRSKWCSTWRDVLRSFGAYESVDRPPPAVPYTNSPSLLRFNS